jgi:hypothetical protein
VGIHEANFWNPSQMQNSFALQCNLIIDIGCYLKKLFGFGQVDIFGAL